MAHLVLPGARPGVQQLWNLDGIAGPIGTPETSTPVTLGNTRRQSPAAGTPAELRRRCRHRAPSARHRAFQSSSGRDTIAYRSGYVQAGLSDECRDLRT